MATRSYHIHYQQLPRSGAGVTERYRVVATAPGGEPRVVGTIQNRFVRHLRRTAWEAIWESPETILDMPGANHSTHHDEAWQAAMALTWVPGQPWVDVQRVRPLSETVA